MIFDKQKRISFLIVGSFFMITVMTGCDFTPSFLESSNQSMGSAVHRESATRSPSVSMDRSGRSAESDHSVKMGRAHIQAQSNNARNDYRIIREEAQSRGGRVDSFRTNERSDEFEIRATLQVPSDELDSFRTFIDETVDVQSQRVQYVHRSYEQSQDEITVLEKSLDRLESIQERIQSMDDVDRKMELLMTYTDKRTKLVRELNDHRRRKQTVLEQGQFSDVDLTLTQPLTPEIEWIPDKLSQKWINSWNTTFQTAADALMETPAQILQIFVRTIQYIIYGLFVLIPFWGLWRLSGWIGFRE